MAADSQSTANSRWKKPLLLLVGGAALAGLGIAAGLWLQPGDARIAGGNPAVEPPSSQLAASWLPDDSGDPSFHDTPFDEDSGVDSPTIAANAPPGNSAGVVPAEDSEESPAQVIANYIAIADDELRIGNYAKAMDLYEFVLTQVSGASEAAVRFRLALATEAAGSFPEAIQRYQTVSQKFAQSAWAGVAQLGEARCLASVGQTDKLEVTLLRELLLDDTRFSPVVRGELLHICGRAFAGALIGRQKQSLLDDRSLILPRWLPDPILVLAELPRMLQQTPRPPGNVTFEVLQSREESPDSVYVRVHSSQASVHTLLKSALQRSGFECHFGDSAMLAVNGRRQSLHADDISLSLLLDGLCIPFGLIWTHEGSTVQIQTRVEASADAVAKFRVESAERLLRNALFQSPDSPQIGYSRVALGVLLFQRDRTADALHMLRSQLELQPRSDVEAEASFNVAKCYLALNQQDEALDAFLHSIDSTGGQPLARTAGYLYIGRLQIADELYQPAVSSLVRALALSDDTIMETDAALLLSSAYLLAGNPQGANEILMQSDRRSRLAQPETRDAAAFLSAFCRFRAAVLQDRREREGQTLVTALTRFDPLSQFGVHWALLAAEASEELGLYEQATHHYLTVLDAAPAARLRDRTLLKLAERYRAGGQFDEAAQLLSAVTQSDSELLTLQVALQSAVVASEQGDSDSALQLCRFVLANSDDDAVRRAALKLMGRAYERRQDYEAAVYCFAGMVPARTDHHAGTLANEATPALGNSSQSGERSQP